MHVFRSISSFGGLATARRAVALAAMVATVAAPGLADAAIFNSPAPAANPSSLTFKGAPGTFTGKWTYRSIAISGDPKVPLSKMSLGTSEFDLVEQGGKITGTRPAGKGKTYDVTGFAIYGSHRAPQVVLHSTSVVGGKSYEYDYFGFLMPSWNVAAEQPDTFMGTVVRTDPAAPEAPAVVVSFIATRVAAAAADAGPAARPARPAARAAKPVAAPAPNPAPAPAAN